MLEMNTVIVTGATGFIGGALTKRLLQQGKKVYAISTNDEKLHDLKQYGNVVTIKADFEEYHTIPNFINEQVDIWIHLAWQAKSIEDMDLQMNNMIYSCKTLLISKGIKVKKFIFIGSSYKFRILETDNLSYNPSIYGIVKDASEELLKTLAIKNNVCFNTVLFANVFGVGDMSNRSTNSLIKQLKKNENPKLIEGTNYHDWTYIDDAVSGIIAVATKGLPYKSYYIGSRKLRMFKEIVKDVATIISPKINLVFGEFEDNSYTDYSKINLDELYNDTGFSCKSDFRESVLKTAQWLEKMSRERND